MSKAAKLKYYNKNKDKINEARRLKRILDPSVKEKEIAYVKKNYERIRTNDIIRSRLYVENNREKLLLNTARRRSKNSNLEFNLTIDDIIVPDICPVLFIPIDRTAGKKSKHKDIANSPSLDRIDSSKGYIKGNVRVISYRANVLKNNATIEEFCLLLKDAENILQSKGNT